MKQILRKYAEFVRVPDVARLLVTALIARMPVGMTGFALLMFLREGLGNFALAGRVTTANGVRGERAGQVVARVWSFSSTCPSGQCPRVALVRARAAGSDSLMLRRTRPGRRPRARGCGRACGRGPGATC